MMNPTGKKLGSSITKSSFLDIFDGLTAENTVQLDFLITVI